MYALELPPRPSHTQLEKQVGTFLSETLTDSRKVQAQRVQSYQLVPPLHIADETPKTER